MFLSNLLDSPNPTIFELSMSENLNGGLKPAFEYLLQVVGERYEPLFHFYAWKDELYVVLLGFIQRHYLSIYNGSFAENFYALKRVKLDKSGNEIPMKPREKFVSLLLLTIVPYLRHKLAKHYEATRKDEDASPLKKRLVSAIPAGFLFYESWSFMLKILFMFEKSPYYTPLLWLQGLIIARVTGDDMREQIATEERLEGQRGIVGKAMGKAISFIRTGLVASALVFKVIEWYYSPENQSQRESMQGPALIPPPPQPPAISSGVRLPRDPSLCPICHETRVNPAIASSGLAYCYLCINRFVLEHGQCPVTGTKCEVSQIRRIFET